MVRTSLLIGSKVLHSVDCTKAPLDFPDQLGRWSRLGDLFLAVLVHDFLWSVPSNEPLCHEVVRPDRTEEPCVQVRQHHNTSDELCLAERRYDGAVHIGTGGTVGRIRSVQCTSKELSDQVDVDGPQNPIMDSLSNSMDVKLISRPNGGKIHLLADVSVGSVEELHIHGMLELNPKVSDVG